MLIIDSLTGLFRAEYSGISNLASRQFSINNLLNWMRRLGLATDAVFIYTNQVTTQISSYGGNPAAPVGGHVVSHASDYRFFTRVGAQGKRKISLKDNSGVPEFDVECEIGWGGLYSDKTEKKNAEKMIFETLGSLTAEQEETDEVEPEKAETEEKEVKAEKASKKTKSTKTKEKENKTEEAEEVTPEVKVSKTKEAEAKA